MFERATDGDVRALDDTGFVHVAGTVVANDAETLTSPLAVEEDVVLAAWRVEEYEETGDQGAWMPVVSGVVAGTFALADDTGRVAVDPGTHVYDGHSQKTPVGDYPAGVSLHGDANVRVEFDAFPVQHEVELNEDPPATVAAFLEATDAVADPVGDPFDLDQYVDLGRPDGDRRYLEATVRPGDDVEILGYADTRAEDAYGRLDATNLVVGPPPATAVDGFLSLSTRDRGLRTPSGLYRYVGSAGLASVLLALFALVFRFGPGLP